MKTKHLDNEIEKLNLLERTKALTEHGQDMLNEFRDIKGILVKSALHNKRKNCVNGLDSDVCRNIGVCVYC